MQLNPYGEYAVLLGASLANNWPGDRDEIEQRTRDVGMTMPFPERRNDHGETREVIDDWLCIVDAPTDEQRAELLNRQMARASAYPRMVDHDGEGWHLHYRDDGQSLPQVLRSVIAVGTALHLTTRGIAAASSMRGGTLHPGSGGRDPQRPPALLLSALRQPGRGAAASKSAALASRKPRCFRGCASSLPVPVLRYPRPSEPASYWSSACSPQR